MERDNRKIRYGIIGFGRFGEKAIAPAIRASKNSELVAIQKRSLAAAQAKAVEHGVPLAFETAEQLVAHPDVDAVFIVSANGVHREETVAAARAGKHVLVEKPMANSVSEAGEMIASCEAHHVKLAVGHMLRLSPLVQRMKEIVQAGEIGPVTFVRSDFYYDARGTQRTWLYDRAMAGGGPVFDVGVHCLDTLRCILDDEVVSVKSELAPVPTPEITESLAQLVLRFARGVVGSIYCSYATPVRQSFIELFGTDGILSCVDFTLGSRTAQLQKTTARKDGAPRYEVEDIPVPNLYVEEITQFSDCILNGSAPILSGQNGLENMRVLEAALRTNGR